MNPRSALLVGLVTASLLSQSHGPAGAPRATKLGANAAQAHNTVTYGRKLEVEDWPRETMHRFFSTRAVAASEAKAKKCPLPDGTPVDFVVATVPDPENSRYPYMFDRFLEGMTRAAQDEGYTRDRYWLPWSAESASPDADWIKREQHQDWRERVQEYPGILLFRKADTAGLRVLGVLLVGENSVSGINKEQFANALALIAHFAGKPVARVRILGPTFSGSATSLNIAMRTLAGRMGVQCYRVITGSATAPDMAQTLAAGAPVDYSAAIENDDVAKCRFFSYLTQHGVNLDRVAILTETGTAYGSQFGRAGSMCGPIDRGQPLVLQYPMEISRLRNAYAENSEAGALSDTASAPPPQGLPINLKALPGAGDSIPSFSAAMSPVAQEAALMSTLGVIARTRIEYAGIVASDILDAVFLARMLKQHCQDVRLFMFDADLAYANVAQNHAFEGMLMVTTYPLFPVNQLWTKSWNRARPMNVFSTNTAQGVYNACRLLISNGRLTTPLAEYAPPRWDKESQRSRPALWLTVVGRDGLWPLKTLVADGEGDRNAQIDLSLEAVAPPAAAKNQRKKMPPPALARGWMLGFCLITVYSLLFSARVLYANRGPEQRAQHGQGLLAIFEAGRDPRAKLYLTALGSGLLAAYALVALAQVGYFTSNQLWDSVARSVAAIGALTFALLFAAIICCWVPGKRRWLGGVAGACLGIMTMRGLVDLADTLPFLDLYRSVHIGSGVSPVVPALFLLCALSWYPAAHLNSIRLQRAMPLKLPSFPGNTFLDSVQQECRGMLRAIERWWFGNWSWAAVTALAFSVTLWLLEPRRMGSLEGRLFASCYLTGLFVLYGALLFGCVRFLYVWHRLRAVLCLLERGPLSQTFERLGRHKELSPAAVWRWGARPTDITLPYAIERLRTLTELRVTRPLDEWHDFDYRSKLAELEHHARQLIGASSSCKRLERRALARVRWILFDVSNHLIRSALASPVPDACAERMPRAAVAVASTRTQPMVLVSGPFEANHAAEEFVALRFVALIRYGNLQLKNMLEFVVAALILAVISLVSYPFEPHHLIMTAITTCFAASSVVFLLVFVQMNRNTVMSHLNGTQPGKLDANLWHLVQFGGLPLLTVLSAQFPTIGGFLFAWLKPALETLR